MYGKVCYSVYCAAVNISTMKCRRAALKDTAITFKKINSANFEYANTFRHPNVKALATTKIEKYRALQIRLLKCYYSSTFYYNFGVIWMW